MKATLSVVISAFNEETKIAECLASVKDLADEIIVVDNESTDKTAALARKYTKKVFTQKNNPLDIDRQKNFGFSKATKDWILSLDADERVTLELASEIHSVLSQNAIAQAYWIPRRNIIFGKQIEHTGWYPDYQLRLFRTGKGSFVKQHFHEPLYVAGEQAYLHTDLLHENFQTIQQFLSRNLFFYAKNEAQAKLAEGYQFSYVDALWFPVREFMSRFFAREGYKDGLHGLILSLLMAVYHFTVFTYIWEEKGFVQEEISMANLEHHAKKIAKECGYWFLTSEITDEKNPLKKIVLKTKRKTL